MVATATPQPGAGNELGTNRCSLGFGFLVLAGGVDRESSLGRDVVVGVALGQSAWSALKHAAAPAAVTSGFRSWRSAVFGQVPKRDESPAADEPRPAVKGSPPGAERSQPRPRCPLTAPQRAVTLAAPSGGPSGCIRHPRLAAGSQTSRPGSPPTLERVASTAAPSSRFAHGLSPTFGDHRQQTGGVPVLVDSLIEASTLCTSHRIRVSATRRSSPALSAAWRRDRPSWPRRGVPARLHLAAGRLLAAPEVPKANWRWCEPPTFPAGGPPQRDRALTTRPA